MSELEHSSDKGENSSGLGRVGSHSAVPGETEAEQELERPGNRVMFQFSNFEKLLKILLNKRIIKT
jgi:hypothetical protein